MHAYHIIAFAPSSSSISPTNRRSVLSSRVRSFRSTNRAVLLTFSNASSYHLSAVANR